VLFDRTALKNSIVPALMFYNLQNPVNHLMPILNVLHLESDKERNEKLIIPMMTLILVAFFEQVLKENVYITVIAIAILCLA
jgi:hypothetical protein